MLPSINLAVQPAEVKIFAALRATRPSIWASPGLCQEQLALAMPAVLERDSMVRSRTQGNYRRPYWSSSAEARGRCASWAAIRGAPPGMLSPPDRCSPTITTESSMMPTICLLSSGVGPNQELIASMITRLEEGFLYNLCANVCRASSTVDLMRRFEVCVSIRSATSGFNVIVVFSSREPRSSITIATCARARMTLEVGPIPVKAIRRLICALGQSVFTSPAEWLHELPGVGGSNSIGNIHQAV